MTQEALEAKAVERVEKASEEISGLTADLHARIAAATSPSVT